MHLSPPEVELSVILPAYNEAQYLAATVDDIVTGLRRRGRAFEVLIVENGSTDGTPVLAAELAAAHPEVSALSMPDPDYGSALRRGLLTSSGGVVVNFDVDHYDLDFLDAAVRLLEETDAAVVVGTKRGAGAQDERAPGRRAVTALFSAVMKVGFGLRASDTHGMKALRRSAVAPLAEQCRLGTDLFDTELVLRTERAGRRVVEVPVRVEERRPPRSSIVRRMARTVVGLVRLRFAIGRRPRP